MGFSLSNRARRDWSTIGVIVAFAILVSGLFSFLTSERTGQSLVQGMIDGAFVGLVLAVYSRFVASRSAFKRLRFVSTVLVHSIAYVSLFLAARAAGQLIGSFILSRGAIPVVSAEKMGEFFGGNFAAALALLFVLSLSINFVLEVNTLLGQNVLMSFLTGRYHRPRVEHRIFMFLDLADSTRLAETLGNDRFLDLLRQVLERLTEPVLETRGEIYKYVGDEIILSWRAEATRPAADWARCFFLFQDALRARAEQYIDAFGELPRFRAAVHAGDVIAGEIGDIRREIAYIGDVLNTTARLEELAKNSGRELVASRDALENGALPAGIEAEPIGTHQLRGKETDVDVFSLRRIPH